ncbi:MAG TPA: peptidyl-prolyl cis-trans isomerase, partial [Planctomycetes bacterium]|nr:peptidyl-prolyl cis-trans isomerase [Planctomycetota bacterium]
MLTLLLTLALQTPATPAPAPGDEGWTTVAGIALQAGGRIVTLGELDRLVRRAAEKRDLSPSDPRYGLLAWSAVEQLTRNELIPEAGQDLGLDPSQVQRIAMSQIDDERRDLGTIGLADRLAARGDTFESLAKSKEADLYRQIWNAIEIGGQRILGKRSKRDSFIRPGELQAIYRTNKDLLDPDVVQLQVLIAPVAAYGDEETGREFLEEVRQEALRGEDFSALVDEYSSVGRETQGLQPPTPVPQIAYPELRGFASRARAGDISEVMSLELGGQPHLLLARIERKQEGHPPAFDQRDVQRTLRQTFQRQRTERLVESEQGKLLRDAFTWVNPALVRLKAAAAVADSAPPP